MFCEEKRTQTQRARAYAAEHCALLEQRFTSRRACVYFRTAEDDPPNPFARPPCTLKTWWSLAPPYKRPANAGDARADPVPALRGLPQGGDG